MDTAKKVQGRIIAQYSDIYKVKTDTSVIYAEVSGKFMYESLKRADYPTVGDYVILDRDEDTHGNAIIKSIMPRKSVFIRKAAGTSNELQIVASNIDIVFICMSLNKDFNVSRIERYLSVAWDSGAIPVILLTKADLSPDFHSKKSEIEGIALGVQVITVSSVTRTGFEELHKLITENITVAFIGSSGVGKSSIINILVGYDILETNNISWEDKGRHTTTNRQLITLASGAQLIDTPGMRELGLDSVNLTRTFSDIDELSKACKFKDCKHEYEPGCAVRSAINEKLLDEKRLMSYNKLKKEARYEGLNSKQIEKEKINDMYSSFDGIKNARNFIKNKNKK